VNKPENTKEDIYTGVWEFHCHPKSYVDSSIINDRVTHRTGLR
jgi:hypothetical protein